MKRRIIKTILIFLALCVLIINVLAYNHAGCLMKFADSGQKTEQIENLSLLDRIKVLFNGVTIPRPANSATPDQFNLPFEDHRIPAESPDGIALHGWVIPAENATKLAVLYHGYCDTKSSMLQGAAVFHDAGWNVAMIDFRGSGQSGGSGTSIGYFESEDVRRSYDYFVETLQPEKTLVLGHSMGSAAVLKAIAEGMSQPDRLVIEAVFSRMITTTRNRFQGMHIPASPLAELLIFWGGIQAGFNGFRHNPIEYASAVTCDSLFLHGSRDQRAHVADARHVAEAVQGQVTFIEFPDAGHEHFCRRNPKLWTQHVLAFAQH